MPGPIYNNKRSNVPGIIWSALASRGVLDRAQSFIINNTTYLLIYKLITAISCAQWNNIFVWFFSSSSWLCILHTFKVQRRIEAKLFIIQFLRLFFIIFFVFFFFFFLVVSCWETLGMRWSRAQLGRFMSCALLSLYRLSAQCLSMYIPIVCVLYVYIILQRLYSI